MQDFYLTYRQLQDQLLFRPGHQWSEAQDLQYLLAMARGGGLVVSIGDLYPEGQKVKVEEIGCQTDSTTDHFKQLLIQPRVELNTMRT